MVTACFTKLECIKLCCDCFIRVTDLLEYIDLVLERLGASLVFPLSLPIFARAPKAHYFGHFTVSSTGSPSNKFYCLVTFKLNHKLNSM